LEDKYASGTLYKHLRHLHKSHRKRYGSYERRGRIKNAVSIEQRPSVVDSRSRIDDWEGDTVIGKNKKSAIYTLVDGLEFAEHEHMAKALDADIYFAHPHSSWERGINENTNGLIKQYFPKGTDFNKITNS
jgi:IS30 family transposase